MLNELPGVYLAVAVFVRVGDLRLAAGHRLAGAAQAEALLDVVDRVRSRRLAHAVHLHDGHVEAHEVLGHFARQGCGAGQEHSSPIETEGLAHFLED